MTASEIAYRDLPELSLVDSCDKAMGYMDEFKLSQFPVVNGSLYIGLIYEEDVYQIEDWSLSIAQSKVRLPQVCVMEEEHFLSVVERLYTGQISVVPVVDQKNMYKGVVSRSTIVDIFGNASIVQDIGSVIEIEMVANDYYLTEIVRVVEHTGVKVLGTYIRSLPDVNKIILTLKINTQHIEQVLSALDRYGYKVFASYNLKSEDSIRKDRFDNLMHFLNL
jgi:predicted transcriptional regulator